MLCPKCQFENIAGSKLCQGCGNKLNLFALSVVIGKHMLKYKQKISEQSLLQMWFNLKFCFFLAILSLYKTIHRINLFEGQCKLSDKGLTS